LAVAAILAATLLSLPHVAQARRASKFALRVGAASLDMSASPDTPLLGGWFGDAVTQYNEGADAYNAAHGYSAGDPNAAHQATRDDLRWRGDLVQITPSVRSGARGYYVQLDLPIGFGDGVRTVGAGIYPVNVGTPIGKNVLVRAGAGVALSWAWFAGVSGSAGGLAQGRLVLGAEVGGQNGGGIVVEIGYTVRALGAVVDRKTFAGLGTSPSGPAKAAELIAAPMPAPGALLRGGEQSGMVDVAVGVTF
jgi:hypothetical protein